MRARILHRYNEANYWAELNPVLGEGEVGIESDTGYCKLGDGNTHWASLPYCKGEGQEYFYAPMSRIPKNFNDFAHRGWLAIGYIGSRKKCTERAFMYLKKTVNGITTCELVPISLFADIRD
jgi:hypothetical protein